MRTVVGRSGRKAAGHSCLPDKGPSQGPSQLSRRPPNFLRAPPRRRNSFRARLPSASLLPRAALPAAHAPRGTSPDSGSFPGKPVSSGCVPSGDGPGCFARAPARAGQLGRLSAGTVAL